MSSLDVSTAHTALDRELTAATLLRSKDPGREFGDMAGKAMSVQWMVENAQTVFQDERE